MPPIFCSEDFEFENDLIPEHFESQDAVSAPIDPTKYWLEYSEWEDESTMSSWPLAVNIDNLVAAELLREARIRYIKRVEKPKSLRYKAEIVGRVTVHSPKIRQE